MTEPEENFSVLEERNFKLSENAKLSYIISQGPKELTIIFIHGLGSSKYDFLDALNFEELISYNIILVDLVGHGNSSVPEGFSFTMKEQAEVLLKLVNSLNLSEDLVIVAHSMGGPVGIILAELLGVRCVGLVYVEGNLDENDCFFSSEIIFKHNYEEWLTTGFATYVKDLQANPEMKGYAENFIKAGAETIFKSSFDLVKESKEKELFYRIINLSIPILAIYGEKNKGRFTSEEKLASKFPVVFIPNTAHDLMIKNPKIFYETIIDFLSQF
ncbi:MAG: alpha/beta hydrolase [Candidatus Heimdallarchaeota archaeon]|nr:alpha/beta hydrolase [Candidatus Heimdallarchaeota archaeon]